MPDLEIRHAEKRASAPNSNSLSVPPRRRAARNCPNLRLGQPAGMDLEYAFAKKSVHNARFPPCIGDFAGFPEHHIPCAVQGHGVMDGRDRCPSCSGPLIHPVQKGVQSLRGQTGFRLVQKRDLGILRQGEMQRQAPFLTAGSSGIGATSASVRMDMSSTATFLGTS